MWQDTFNTLVSLGALLMQVFLALGILAWAFVPEGKLVTFLQKRGIALAFLVSLAGMLLSLFYSEIIGYAPCELCWYQRIALYPLVVVFGTQLLVKEKSRSLFWTGMILSGAGLLISAYQYFASAFFPGALACAASQVSCAKVYFTSFGYITIPMMALTSFALTLFLVLVSEKK